MTHRAFAHLALAAIVATGCNSDKPTENGPAPADILVDATSFSIKQHETARIVPVVVDAKGTLLAGFPVTFVSSNPAIVTVSNIGVVTSVGPAGAATISVRAGGLTKPVSVTVAGIPTSISVTPSPAVVTQNATVQLDAKLLDLDGVTINGATFTYTSSNPALATVSASGLVTSVGPAGSAVITVASGEVAKTVPVVVTAVPTRLTLPPSIMMGRNSSLQLRAVVLDAVGAEIPNVAISYTSGAPQIVAVSATGLLTTTGATGSATITGRLEQLTATTTVNVVQSGHPMGNIVSSSPASGYGAAITAAGDFYVTGLNGTPVRGTLPNYTTLTPLTAVQAGLAVVTNRAGNAVFFAGVDGVVAYDPAQNQVRWTSAAGKGTPFDVALSDDESTVYLTTSNSVVVAINATTGAINWELALTGGYTAVHLAENPSKNVLYASGPTSSVVAEIDLNTHTVAYIPVPGGSPQDIVVSPDGSELYVALEGGGLAFVNTNARTATAIATQCAGYGLIMTPDTQQLWIGCSQGGSITVVDRQNRTIVQTIPVGDVRRLAITPDGLTVLASGQSIITFIR